MASDERSGCIRSIDPSAFTRARKNYCGAATPSLRHSKDARGLARGPNVGIGPGRCQRVGAFGSPPGLSLWPVDRFLFATYGGRMGSFRFRRSIKIAPGIRLNVNKRSIGVSAGVRGARASINSNGRSTRSIGIPGTGLYYRSQTGPRSRSPRATFDVDPNSTLGTVLAWIGGIGIVAVVVAIIVAVATTH